jgi:serine/threonine protein kinase
MLPWRLVDNPDIQADGQRKEVVNLISSMLRWNPKERLSAEELLKYKWLNS